MVTIALGPYMAETSALLMDGVKPDALDKALTSFGFPVGPVSLADEVGIDVAGHVQEVSTFLINNTSSLQPCVARAER